MIRELLTGRLWLRDTSTGRLFRRATLADVIHFRRLSAASRIAAFAADGRWAAFELVENVGFDLSDPGMPRDILAKLIGVLPFQSTR